MLKLPLRVIIETLIYLSACGFAVWKGGKAERFVGLVLAAELLLLIVVQKFDAREGLRPYSTVLDLAALALILYITFKSDERWLLLGSALQLLSVLTNVTRGVDRTVHSWSSVTIGITLGFGLIATLVYGTFQAMRHRGEFSHERH